MSGISPNWTPFKVTGIRPTTGEFQNPRVTENGGADDNPATDEIFSEGESAKVILLTLTSSILNNLSSDDFEFSESIFSQREGFDDSEISDSRLENKHGLKEVLIPISTIANVYGSKEYILIDQLLHDVMGAVNALGELKLLSDNNQGSDDFELNELRTSEGSGSTTAQAKQDVMKDDLGHNKKILNLDQNNSENHGHKDVPVPNLTPPEASGVSSLSNYNPSMIDNFGHNKKLTLQDLSRLLEVGGLLDRNSPINNTPESGGFSGKLLQRDDTVFDNEGHKSVLSLEDIKITIQENGQKSIPVPVMLKPESGGQKDSNIKLTIEADAKIDTFIDELNVDTNNETSSDLRTDETALNNRKSFIQFDTTFLKPVVRTISNDPANAPRKEYLPIAIWQFDADDDEAPAGKTADQSGLGMNLTKDGVTLVDAHTGKGYSFDGSNDRLRFTFADEDHKSIVCFNSISEFTVGFKIKRNGNPAAGQYLIGTRAFTTGTLNSGWLIHLSSAGRIVFIKNDGVNQFSLTSDGTTTITDNAWHRVIVRQRYTASKQVTVTIHIDTVANGSATDGGVVEPIIPSLRDDFYIGSNSLNQEAFGGVLDEVRIYGGALVVADMDSLLLNPYEIVNFNGWEVESAKVHLRITDSEILPTNLQLIVCPIHEFPFTTVTWNRRPLRSYGPIENVFGSNSIVAPATPSNFTIDLTNAVLDALKSSGSYGKFLLILKNDTEELRTFQSINIATADNRPKLTVVMKKAN